MKPTDKKSQQKKALIAFGVLGGIVIIPFLIAFIAVSALPSPAPDSSSNTPPIPDLNLGDQGYLYLPDSTSSPFLVGTSKESEDQLVQSMVARDHVGVTQLVQSGQALLLDPGTQIDVIDVETPDDFEGRVESGQYAGQAVWMPGEFISKTPR